LAAAILAGHTTADQPSVGGYALVLWLAVGSCVVAGGLGWVLPARAEVIDGQRAPKAHPEAKAA
jgi:hypothetical protein